MAVERLAHRWSRPVQAAGVIGWSRVRNVDPLTWSGVDKCLLWLGVVLPLYVFYLYRVDYLLAHPDVEPYFDRPSLRLFRSGLFVVTLACAGLVMAGAVVRRRSPENPWILHAANQTWWVWTSVAAYAIGPVTTPVLGLVVLGGFVGLLLFPRRVVLPALASGLSVLVLTTLAERAELIPYAPLFHGPPRVDGRLSFAYVVVTSATAFIIIAASFVLVSYLVERERSRERTLLATSDERARAEKELQQALESLRVTEEGFRQLAENAREVFWLMDVETRRLLYLSPAFETVWRMPCADVYEHSERFLERVHPEDRARVADRFHQFAATVGWQAHWRQVEYRLVHPDEGETRWVRVRAFPIRDAEGRIYRLGGLIEDITERRSIEAALARAHADLERRVEERTAELSRSNERLQHEAIERRRAESALRASEAQLRAQLTEIEHLYQHAPIGLAFQDTEFRYVRINARLAAINGHAAEAHIGHTLSEMIPEIAPTVVPIMRRVLDTGEPALNIEVRGSTPAEPETDRYWLTSYYPVQSPDGPVLGVSVVVQDISEIRWAEQRAHQHLEDLAHVARLRTMGEMATGIAHELNQPLTAIVNYAFIGRRRVDENGAVDPTEIRNLFEALSTQALRAGGIVQHLRAFVKKAHRERVATSLNELIGDVLTLVGFELRQNGLQPVLELEAALPQVYCDTIQIQQVILNLVRNAVDAMASTAEAAPTERRLTITSTRAGDLVEVAVRDTGTGVLTTDMARVFDAFYTTKREGMGMGLAISRSIIQDHGGRLWVEANPEEGTTFRFTLPVAQERRGTAT